MGGTGSRPSTSQTARSGSLSTRLQHSAALRPNGLRSVQMLCRSRPARSAAPLCCSPAPPIPTRMGCGGRWPAGPRLTGLSPPLLVAGRRLTARVHPSPLPAGPVHPRRRLQAETWQMTTAFAGEVDMLLYPATYCSRWASLT